MKITCWHGRADTLPRLVRHPRDSNTVDVFLTVGIDLQLEAADPPHTPDVQIKIAGQTLRELTRADLQTRFDQADRDHASPDRNAPVRPYADLNQLLQSMPYRYFELELKGRQYGSTYDYSVEYFVDGAHGYANGEQRAYQLLLRYPTFSAEHIRHTRSADSDPHWWVLSATAEAEWLCLRLDMLNSIDPGDPLALPRVRFSFPNSGQADIDVAGGPVPGRPLPIVDRNTDTIRVYVKRDGVNSVVVTTTGADGQRQESATFDKSYFPTRLLLLNYCIQGLNDLFAPPLDSYDPPRTYIQVTLRDENGVYSSRPDRKETGAPDGYAFTLEAHKYFKVKSQWAFNAGVLMLIAHDRPEDLDVIKGLVAEGLLAPCNAGFGAHRPPYYHASTNWLELQAGKDLIRNYLHYDKPGLDVYYPDQRLFKGRDNELSAYRDAGVKYLVFDRSTVCNYQNQVPKQLWDFFDPGANYLWTLAGSGIGLLLIEDEFRDGIDSFDDDLTFRGKAGLNLRRRFMQLVAERTRDAKPHLMVYGDDADKASGNGWFDGDFDGHKYHFSDMYSAFLKWVSDHPWVDAITTDSLDLGTDSKGTLPVLSATCPSVDPGGAASLDQYGNTLHFDAWYAAWRAFRADWLGKTLGALSDELEHSLVTWPEEDRNEAHTLAWLYFLMFTHESFWNKEPADKNRVNAYREVQEPADFVVTESLQQRHAWVFLRASRWAVWARDTNDDRTYLDEGEVCKDGLCWDQDLMPNAILYNNQVLVVMDRNGGCITNIFVLRNREPVSVSGHFKSFQYLDTSERDVRNLNPGVMSNGFVFQNTVFTPNHAYVAADVRQTRPILGNYTYPLPQGRSFDQAWNYPNNFNEYEYERLESRTARFRYGPPSGPVPDSLDRLAFADYCLEDRTRRTIGSQGLVWHDPKIRQFEKEISLDRHRLQISYRNAPAGHVVSNEFCVDLLRAVMHKDFQDKRVMGDRTVTLRAGRAAVTVQPGRGCTFSNAVLLRDDKEAAQQKLLSEYLTLHRVLTDNLQMECPRGGSFDYTIEFA